MRDLSKLLACGLFLTFVGCSDHGTLTGQVFIVTEGSENIRLGLVDVIAVSAPDMKAHLQRKKADLATEDADLNARDLATAEDSLRLARQVAEEAYKNFYGKPGYDDRAYAKLTAAEEDRDAKALKVQALHSDNQGSRRPLKERLDDCFVGLPSALSHAITDADGKFRMEVPKNVELAVVARASRRVGLEQESYFWILWTSLNGKSSKDILLSNNNLLRDVPP